MDDERRSPGPVDEARPLTGKRILVLRTLAQAAAFVAGIEALGGEAVLHPVIQIADPGDWGPLDGAIREIDRYQWLVITSPNGAQRFAHRLAACGRSVADLAHLRVAAVGTTTAEALAQHGIQADLLPAEFTGKAMVPAMAPYVQPGDRVLLARGDLANPALAAGLMALGAHVDDRVAYRTLPAPVDEGVAYRTLPAQGDGGVSGPGKAGDPMVGALRGRLAAGEIDYVAFTSGSTVRNLLAQIGDPLALAGVRVACIGPETASEAERLGLTVTCTAAPYTMEGLLRAIVEDCRQGGR